MAIKEKNINLGSSPRMVELKELLITFNNKNEPNNTKDHTFGWIDKEDYYQMVTYKYNLIHT